tara:strand:+ start:37 stop:342 length:306 start_codon:yes stop_codon:yes gene_type:complete
MGQSEINLVKGMTLYDVDTKSIGLLVRRFSTREVDQYDDFFPNITIPHNLWDHSSFVVWVWDSVWSRDGRIIYSETGLINLIKAGIVVILDSDAERIVVAE